MSTPDQSDPQANTRLRGTRLAIVTLSGLVLLTAGLIGGIVILSRPQPQKPAETQSDATDSTASQHTSEPAAALTSAAARALLSESLRAIGHLENLELEAADPLLSDLTRKLPQEPLGPRNLTICRFLAFDGGKGSREAVLEALRSLRNVQPEEPYTFWLEAKTSLKESANQAADPVVSEQWLKEAIQALRSAADRAPRNEAVRYQIFEAARNSTDVDLQSIGEAALAEAYQLDPDNLFILSDWLLLQARRQDSQILETLTRARTTIAPLQPLVEARSRVNLDDLIGQAEQAVREGKWPVATARIRVVFVNLMRPLDAAQSDKRRLDPHPLEFAIARWSDAFYARYNLSDPPPPPAIPVQLSPFPAAAQLPELNDANDLCVVDFDLDGQPDLIVLREQRLEIYRQATSTQDAPASQLGTWSVLTSIETGGTFRRLLVADLDHDRDHARTHEVVTTTTPDEAANAQRRSQVCFDADLDLVLYGTSGLRVLRNVLDPMTQQRTLVPVESSIDPPLTDIQAGVLVDFDSDSNLDLVLTTATGIVPLLSRGDLTFLDARAYSQLPPADAVFHDLLVVDWDRDVDLDVIAVAPNAASIGYLENLRHGNFRWVPLEDASFHSLRQANSLTLLDADGNQAWDVVGVSSEHVSLVTTRLSPTGTVVPIANTLLPTMAPTGDNNATTAAPSPSAAANGERVSPATPTQPNANSSSTTPAATVSSDGHHVLPWDFDNDGFLDLLVWKPTGIVTLHGGPRATFSPITGLINEPLSQIRRIEVADIDQDGDLDLAVATGTGIQLLSNEGGNRHHWFRIRAMGQVDNKGKANHNGLGSLVEVKSGSHYQAQIVNRPVTHFGMGDQARADVVRFVWTNGVPQAIVNPSTDEAICELMILKGSCPYVYTWTGERFEFFTDLLWAAPIGLQFAENVLAPARPWEYLLIPGERLQPRDGHYTLQLTEELWEAAYFDQVELLAVDHPAEYEVFSNEKVGPAEIAAFRVHTARQRRAPLIARDSQGRDVLDQVRQRDGVYFRGFERQIVPGLVNEHFLELDLGPLETEPPKQLDPNTAGTARSESNAAASNPQPNPPLARRSIRLFLHGWIYPTDTSLNVGLSRHPTLKGPQPPSLWVPDADGQWREVMPYIGFPGGKPKTIVVDLTNAFLTNDYRLRIVTSNEIYWDEVSFTVDEPTGDFQVHPLELVSADLHYRGFSHAYPLQPNAPEWYDYDRVSSDAKWPPMQGFFTRYGDVRELLIKSDDQLLVMSAGDETTLRFAVPSKTLPEGWKRDFFLHNVGWDKDADLNTVYGQTVEPLPFQAMRSYPFPIDQEYPATEILERYLKTYQTRQQPRDAYWRALRPASLPGTQPSAN